MTRKRYMPTFKAQIVQELLKEEKTLALVGAWRRLAPTSAPSIPHS
jgi:hypothetical protein